MKLWLRTLVFLVLVPGMLLGVVPAWLLTNGWSRQAQLGAIRWIGAPLLAAGILTMLWCFDDFVRKGLGTPAPIDPPKRLVIQGLYRWVRNPMYLGGILILLGEAILWEAPRIVGILAAFWAATHTFVVMYEEPALLKTFGEPYRRYREGVPRWLPRVPPRR